MKAIIEPKTRKPSPGRKSFAATDERRVKSSIDRSSRRLIKQWLKGQSFRLILIGDRWIVIPTAD